MRRNIFVLVSVLLLLAGCVSGRNDSGYSMQETMFASMMIPHHEQAIVMSDLALSKSTNPDVLELARGIKATQKSEIERMKVILSK